MTTYQLGDMVYAAVDLSNDSIEETGAGGFPGVAADALLAAAGTRGVVVNVGHAEAQPDTEIYLVRFETDPAGQLGDAIGCLAEELSHHRVAA
jgi:nitrogen fixation protein NifZ